MFVFVYGGAGVSVPLAEPKSVAMLVAMRVDVNERNTTFLTLFLTLHVRRIADTCVRAHTNTWDIHVYPQHDMKMT